MENNQDFCPQCGNHCPKNELKCGKGRAYFNIDNHSAQPHHQQEQGLFGLLKACGHQLHHNKEITNSKLCEGLTSEELTTLETLLQKVLANLDKN